jgi:hypothetical protein
MEAELSKDRMFRVERELGKETIWLSLSGSLTVGGMFTKKDCLLIYDALGSVVK